MNRMKEEQVLKHSLTAWIPAVTLLYLLLIYAPIETYVANVEGFTHDIYDLLRVMFPGFILAALLTALFFFLMYRIRIAWGNTLAAVIFALLLAIYLQGTFFSGRLPPLDGSSIDWTAYNRQRLFSVCLFTGSGALLFLLFRVLKWERFARLVRGVSVFLLLILFVSTVIISIPGEGRRDKKDLLVTEDHILGLSKDQPNFVILLFDQVGGDNVKSILQEDPSYEEAFEDFTFFPNTVGAYPFTQYAIPFILTGEWYENGESFFTYRDRTFAESPLFAELEQRSYRIGVYDEDLPVNEKASGRFENTVIFDSKAFNAPVEFIKTQLKLVGLKYLPYGLKKYCMVSPDFLYANSRKANGQPVNSYEWSNASFFKKVMTDPIEYTDDSSFRFVHLSGAHDPFIYDENMNVVEQSGYTACVKASLKCAEEYCRRLKEANCYDNTVIIVMSDHGYFSETRQVPLVMIKGAKEKHRFQISEAPLSYADLQPLFKELLDGASAQTAVPRKEGEQTERRYLDYIYACEDQMWEYIQTGYATEESTFLRTGREYIRAGEHITTNSFF